MHAAKMFLKFFLNVFRIHGCFSDEHIGSSQLVCNVNGSKAVTAAAADGPQPALV